MAAILKFKMEDEGVVGKNDTYIFRIQHILIDKKSEKNQFWHAYRAGTKYWTYQTILNVPNIYLCNVVGQ